VPRGVNGAYDAFLAALLLTGGRADVADAFCASRLAHAGRGRAFGTLPTGVDPAPLLDRALPVDWSALAANSLTTWLATRPHIG
jgi:hypothetical protein